MLLTIDDMDESSLTDNNKSGSGSNGAVDIDKYYERITYQIIAPSTRIDALRNIADE